MDTVRILVATDCHLGVDEGNDITENDGFIAFDEVFGLAKKHDVDMVLLGGDLFHYNKPTQPTLCKTMDILTRHVLGDNPVQFQILSDQKVNFPSRGVVNYEDPNLNVSIPVMSIHGNHDDPNGMGQYAALDILSRAGLVNYFGKADNLSNIEVQPILIDKGGTRVALYGLGSIRDERLHRIFLNKNIRWVRPAEDREDWFNLLVLHQNRVQHSPIYKNCIPEGFLPDFLDFVVWGHEHECRLHPEPNTQRNFYVSQPGSTCRTSLCLAETGQKCVGLLEIQDTEWKMTALKLEYQRPFMMDDINLMEYVDEINCMTDPSMIDSFLSDIVERMIEQAGVETRLPSDSPSVLSIPYIRLRVTYGDAAHLNVQQFGQKFVSRVANPESILLTSKKRRVSEKDRKSQLKDDVSIAGLDAFDELNFLVSAQEEASSSVQSIVNSILENTNPLVVFEEHRVTKAVEQFVEKNETLGFLETFFIDELEKMQKLAFETEGITQTNLKDFVERETQRKRLEANKVSNDEIALRVQQGKSNFEGTDGHVHGTEDVSYTSSGEENYAFTKVQKLMPSTNVSTNRNRKAVAERTLFSTKAKARNKGMNQA